MIKFNAKTVMDRNRSYLQYRQDAQSVSITHGQDEVAPARWTPLPPDIANAEALFAFLSPEVRRFAITVEAQLRGLGGFAFDHERPRRIYNSLLLQARHLLEAISHRGVTDASLRPLALDHPDRNPRRIANVLREAVNAACHCIVIADVCGALEESRHG